MIQCIAVRPSGYVCINPAQKGSAVCVSHDPSRQCGGQTKSGARCKRMKVRGKDTCSYH